MNVEQRGCEDVGGNGTELVLKEPEPDSRDEESQELGIFQGQGATQTQILAMIDLKECG